MNKIDEILTTKNLRGIGTATFFESRCRSPTLVELVHNTTTITRPHDKRHTAICQVSLFDFKHDPLPGCNGRTMQERVMLKFSNTI